MINQGDSVKTVTGYVNEQITRLEHLGGQNALTSKTVQGLKEWEDKVIFLHKIIPGGSDDSYGIYVAKLAGMPESVIQRSKEILSQLEIGTPNPCVKEEKQLSLFVPAPAASYSRWK